MPPIIRRPVAHFALGFGAWLVLGPSMPCSLRILLALFRIMPNPWKYRVFQAQTHFVVYCRNARKPPLAGVETPGRSQPAHPSTSRGAAASTDAWFLSMYPSSILSALSDIQLLSTARLGCSVRRPVEAVIADPAPADENITSILYGTV